MQRLSGVIQSIRCYCRTLLRLSAVCCFIAVMGFGSIVFAQTTCSQIFQDATTSLRKQTISPIGKLSSTQQRELTQMLAMLGIRRSKIARVFEKAKGAIGLQSNDLVPVVPSGVSPNLLGDQVRRLIQDFNSRVETANEPLKVSYDRLMSDLFEVYLTLNFEELSEPWFLSNGKPRSLFKFANDQTFVQQKIAPGNTWMNVVTLTPDKVQNLSHRGLTRDMWWNRASGINPLGTVRVSRNILTLPDGSQKTLSVEVLRRTPEGVFVPFFFEIGDDGILRPLANNRSSIKKMQSCFGCHFRLSGIFFGGISQKGYKAVDDWHINAIDFTKRKSYQKFDAFR